MHAKSLQSCPTLCDPVDCSLPGSSVHGILLRQEYWNRMLCPPPGDLPYPGTKSISLTYNLHWQAGSLPLAPPGKPYMQSTSCEMLGWLNHKLESRLPGEIQQSQICRWYHSNSRKQRGTKEPLDEGERGEWKSWLKTQHLKNKYHGIWPHQFSSIQFSHSVMSESLLPHESQHARPPCPSPTPKVYSNSCPLSRWCHPTISSSVDPFSSRLHSFPASRSFQMSQFFPSGGQSNGVSASALVFPMNIQAWWPGWISLLSKGHSRVFSNTTVQKHQFFGAQPSSQSNSHIHTWLREKL